MGINEILIKVLPLIVAILLGYILFRIKFLNNKMITVLKKIVVNITLPAGLVVAFSFIKFEVSYVVIIIAVFIACLLLLYIAKLIAKLFKVKSPYFPYLLTGFEAGMIGYALYGAIYGMDQISNFGIIDIGQVLFVFLIVVPALITINKKEKISSTLKTSFTTAAKSPIVWAIIIGLVFSLGGIYKFESNMLVSGFKNIFDFIAAPTSLLICLVIGSGLNMSFKGIKLELLTAILKVVFALLMAVIINFLILTPLGVEKLLLRPLLSMFVLPAPFAIPIFMVSEKKEDINYISNTLSIGTAIGVVLFIAIAFITL